MDYKEKYEMALEGIQEILSSGEDSIKMSRLQLRLQGIFPELAESEDEGIRKAIIAIISNYVDSSNTFKPQMLAWLEKARRSDKSPQFTFDDVLALQCAMGTVKKVQEDKELYEQLQSLHDRIHDAYWLEKGDQKSTDNLTQQEAMDIAVAKCFNEQESADKIEPKFKVGDLIKDCNYQGEPIYKIQGMDSQCYICKYTGKENLGDRFIMHFSFDNPYLKLVEQKPAWSEEDENLFKCAIDAVEQESKVRTDGCLDEEVGKMVTDWLKSLKDRFTWKPSEKQMHYLSWIANIKLGDSMVEQEVSKHLNELLEDLKKLKG